MQILIADDDPVLVFTLKAQLEEWGFEVSSCGDGRVALERLSASDGPRLALLDWSMPSLTGPQVCSAVRKTETPDDGYVYVIMLTGRSDQKSIVEALRAGADDFVAKPFELVELKMRLRAARRILDFQAYLREQALIDPLTSLLNRRGLQRSVRAELKRTGRRGEQLASIAVDLDHFKVVNDTHGHDVGDEVLKAVAKRILANLRGSDIAARTGGEEFLVLCPDSDEKAATVVAERLREAVCREPVEIPTSKLSVAVTASCGVSATTGEANSSVRLFREADAALYSAKQAGRNRVVGWSTCKDDV